MHTAVITQDYRLPPEQVPETLIETLSREQRDECIHQIKQLLREQNAVLVAHYYTDPDLQLLADETGGHVSDSLDMARFGHESSAAYPGRLRSAFYGRDREDSKPGKTGADA